MLFLHALPVFKKDFTNLMPRTFSNTHPHTDTAGRPALTSGGGGGFDWSAVAPVRRSVADRAIGFNCQPEAENACR